MGTVKPVSAPMASAARPASLARHCPLDRYRARQCAAVVVREPDGSEVATVIGAHQRGDQTSLDRRDCKAHAFAIRQRGISHTAVDMLGEKAAVAT
ncbi:MAG: hypothetical protein KKG69_01655 [Alphaproteobacteria bacterium]|nr:hypothetical protein [Alphaproteobacteria bacterium]MBU2229964.1 hypothetical protein [Alphaproteobacteria bacterium]